MEIERAMVEAGAIFQAAVRAADPEVLVRDALNLEGSRISAGGWTYTLSPDARLLVVGIGKAAVPMGRGALAALGGRVDGGLLVTKRGPGVPAGPAGTLEVVVGGHPIPDAASEAAGVRLLDLVRNLQPHDLVLMLISGGGSALVEAPAAGLSLDDIAGATQALLRAGADIQMLNAVRRRLSLIKGGRLARAIAPGRVVNLIISDVLGNPLPTIASGPTVADQETGPDPATVAASLGVWDRLSPALRAALVATRAGEPPPDNVLDSLVLADAATAARAASVAAEQLGYSAPVLATDFVGEAREFAGFWSAVARHCRQAGGRNAPPVCLIGAGETTVAVRGRGIGGRNTEMAVAAAAAIEGLEGIAIASLATDGDDGVTGAAGGVVVGTSAARARAAGIDPAAALAENDTARCLAASGGLLVTGATGTNVNDLYLALLP